MVRKPPARRRHSCPGCGAELDRDVNTALDILERGHGLERGYEAVVGLVARKLEVGSGCAEKSRFDFKMSHYRRAK